MASLILVKFVLLFLCISVVVGNTKRSARWDTHNEHLRSKRQLESPAGCNWQNNQATCTLQNVTANDTLGRRASGLLSEPKHQGRCGSCWAFASTHVYTDSRSIAAGRQTSLLSSQFTAACQQERALVANGNGCCGGNPVAGFILFETRGTVTDSCAPYRSELRNFLRAVKAPISQTCPAACSDGTQFNPSQISLYSHNFLRNETQVIAALANRTIYLSMRVSEDFNQYRCGVFCDENPTFIGDHAMEIVDYGTESGVDFWVVKNSWGTNWGEGGYIRMRRGDSNFKYYVAPVLSSEEGVTMSTDTPMDTDEAILPDCAATDVDDPTEDVLVMSAVDHAIDDINEVGSVPCPDGSPATMVVLSSVTTASVQIVDGVMVDLELLVEVRGCINENQIARVTTSVLETGGTFETMTQNHEYVENGARALTSCVAMVLFIAGVLLLV